MKPQLDDCLCPICLEVLIEPVTMPCQHELCMPCFQQNVQEANFFCPLCRLRISSWARAAANEHKLIDQVRWRQIRKFYPKEVANRMSGRSDSDTVIMPPVHEIPRTLSEPGEIRREYEEEIRKFEEQLKLEHEQEEAASRKFIEKLQSIEAAKAHVESVDEMIARRVESLNSSHDVKQVIDTMREEIDKETRVFSSFEGLHASSSNGDLTHDHRGYRCEYSPTTKPKTSKILYDKKDYEKFDTLIRQNSMPVQPKTRSKKPKVKRCVSVTEVCSPASTLSSTRPRSSTNWNHASAMNGHRHNSKEASTSNGVVDFPDSITEEEHHFFTPIVRPPITPTKIGADGSRPIFQPILLVTPIKIEEVTSKICHHSPPPVAIPSNGAATCRRSTRLAEKSMRVNVVAKVDPVSKVSLNKSKETCDSPVAKRTRRAKTTVVAPISESTGAIRKAQASCGYNLRRRL